MKILHPFIDDANRPISPDLLEEFSTLDYFRKRQRRQEIVKYIYLTIRLIPKKINFEKCSSIDRITSKKNSPRVNTC